MSNKLATHLLIVFKIAGSAPVILAFILYNYYTHHPRPDSDPRRIRIPKDVRAVWELAFLIVVAGSLGITVLNLIFYTCFNCLSKNTWTKRFDCAYFTLGGAAQAIVGFIMVASALTSTEEEPLEIKYASGVLRNTKIHI